jgi:hypothetical protein
MGHVASVGLDRHQEIPKWYVFGGYAEPTNCNEEPLFENKIRTTINYWAWAIDIFEKFIMDLSAEC